MTNTLLSTFPTVSSAAAFQQKLSEVKKFTFRTDSDPEKVQQLLFTPAERKALVTYCISEKLSLEATKLADTIDSISKYLSEVPVLTITLASDVSEDTIQTIQTILHSQLKKTALLDFKVDPSIVAGATLEYKGKRLSYTIASIIENALL